MRYGDILVYLPLPHVPNLVEASATVAKAFDAHLTGLSSLPVTSMLRDAVQNPFIRLEEAGEVEQAIASEADQGKAVAQAFAKVAEREGVSHAFEIGEGDASDLLLYASRLQDLIILGKSREASELLHGPVVQVVLSGRPALVLPHDRSAILPLKHAVIAWNGGAQSAAAVRQALPLLAKASRVSVLNGRPHDWHPASRRLPPLDIAAYLNRHGIAAELVAFDVGDDEAGAAILTFADGGEADLLVMGAFGRSRFKEWVLRGATRLVLERMTTPVFMAH
jgi:nucleotide-binding universal stress UspA family protein